MQCNNIKEQQKIGTKKSTYYLKLNARQMIMMTQRRYLTLIPVMWMPDVKFVVAVAAVTIVVGGWFKILRWH